MNENTIGTISFGENLEWPVDETKELDLETMTFCKNSGLPDSSDDLLYQSIDGSVSSQKIQSQSHISSQKYQYHSLLGEGGMAKVWRVEDASLNRSVALKLMHEKFHHDAYEWENFVIEAQLTAQLQHPGIVPIYEMNQDENNQWYFTMREIQGYTLHQLVRKVNRINKEGIWNETEDGWSVKRLITCLIQVCNTLHYAHSKGVVHRDIKPSNIMIGEYGEVLVVDWGIAKIESWNVESTQGVQVEASTEYIAKRTKSICGTPSYMAPEQISSSFQEQDDRCDIYAIGVILYEILVGQKPFKGDFKEIFKQKCNQDSPTIMGLLQSDINDQLRRRIQSIPSSLIEICNKAIESDAESRYTNIHWLSKDLQSWLDGSKRKEKALLMLTEVDRLKVLRLEHIQKANTHRNTASIHLLDKKDVGWDLWEKSNSIFGFVTELEYEIEQILHQGMCYAPEMAQFHRELIEIEHREFIQTIVRGDKYRYDRSLRRIQLHLDHLPRTEAQRWQSKLDKDIQSTIILRRDHGELIGRSDEIEEILSLMNHNRVITIVGPSGIGKTHLMLKCLQEMVSLNDETPKYCTLSHALDSFCIAQQVMRAYNLRLESDETWNEISDYLTTTSQIIAFDNAEKTLEDTKEVVKHLFENMPRVTIILTSRTPLNLPFETVIDLKSLSLTDGIALFVRKAQSRDPEFELDEYNRESVLQIVQHLKGLPMAIELASYKSSVLNLEGIVKRLRVLPELTDINQKHSETLFCTLDWAWDFLPEPSKATLVQCSLFREGFSIELAENSVDLTPFGAEGCIFDSIKLLVEWKLLTRDKTSDGQYRYRMPLSVVEYIHHKPEDANATYFIEQFKSRIGKYLSSCYDNTDSFEQRLKYLELEMENYLLAAIVSPSLDARKCCLATLEFFYIKGPISRAVSLFTMFLGREDIENGDRTKIQDELSKILQQVKANQS